MSTFPDSTRKRTRVPGNNRAASRIALGMSNRPSESIVGHMAGK